MAVLLIFLTFAVLSIYLFMQQPMFGRKPTGERLQQFQQAANYSQNAFQNQSLTPNFTNDANFFTVLNKFFFGKRVRNKPVAALPSVKTNLKALDKDENILVWMGHSSYFMQIDGKTFLVDPVLSGHASPFSFTTNSFAGSDIYTPDDFPEIDFLFISHDHWDHLDYKTVTQLQLKIKNIVTGLGTAQHLERWGFDKNIIIEKNWNEHADLGEGFNVTILPARHFSGRTFTRNKAIWASFALQTPTQKIYLGGDSGYDNHFKEIGNTHGPFNLAILECGQYNEYWSNIHMMPEETVQAAQDLKAATLLPVHWGKFALSMHPWDEPINRVTKAAVEDNMPLLTPIIGEKLSLSTINTAATNHWWQQLN